MTNLKRQLPPTPTIDDNLTTMIWMKETKLESCSLWLGYSQKHGLHESQHEHITELFETYMPT